MKREIKPDHNKNSINETFGIPDYEKELNDLLNSKWERNSHLLEEVINLSKEKMFDVKDIPLNEYEITIAYLAFNIGRNVGAKEGFTEGVHQGILLSKKIQESLSSLKNSTEDLIFEKEVSKFGNINISSLSKEDISKLKDYLKKTAKDLEEKGYSKVAEYMRMKLKEIKNL